LYCSIIAIIGESNSQASALVLLTAPIFGLLGTALGWYLNRWSELRRRQWQLEDDERTWLRTREHERDRWSRDQRKEQYLAFIRAANSAMQEAMETLAFRGRGEQYLYDQRDKMWSLLYVLINEESNVVVLGDADTGRLAVALRTYVQVVMNLAARSADQHIEEEETTAALANFRSSLDALVARIRIELGVIDDVPSEASD
jgi:hypothetical protein